MQNLQQRLPNTRNLGELITTSQLAKVTAGGDNFIRVKDGEVKGLALRLDLNPGAPAVVIVGKGEQREGRAKKLLKSASAVPTYMKRDVDAWEYIGDYRAIKYLTDKSAVNRVSKYRTPDSVAGVLYLQATTTNADTNQDGSLDSIQNRGFPDPKARKEIEEAAVLHVTQVMKARGFAVESHEKLNLGYDLCATKGNKKLLVEVKGTDAPYPRFFLSRNERKCSILNSTWRLAIVCQARKSPKLLEYTAIQMEKKFVFSALAWECTLT